MKIQADYAKHDADRQESLDRARLCSSLTKPWILPPSGWTEGSKLPECFSSLPSRGISNLEGRLIVALFPAGQPFFRLKPAAKFKFDPAVSPEALQEFQQRLHLQELTVMAHLDRADKSRNGNARRAGFRSRMRTAISQLLVTGDVLMQLTDELDVRVFRRDQYVTKRDSAGDVMFHIVKESIDPLILKKSQLTLCDLDFDSLQEKRPVDRMEDIYTRCEWNPVSKKWVIQQECRGKVINETEEKITPFLSTPFELATGSNYGIGLVEQNLGDVRSINELTERLLDHASMASKMLMVTDYNSQVRPSDLAMPTGSVIQGRVQSGQVTDVALLRADKGQDFGVANSVRESIRKDLATVMLMEAEQLPTYERASRLHVQRVASELEQSLGAVYVPICDSLQVPLVERIREVMVKKNLLPSLPDDVVEIEAVTGIHAISQETDQQKLLSLLQMLSQLGPDTMSRVNQGILLDLLMRQSGLYEPGLVKSEEELKREIQEQQKQQQQAMAASQMVSSAGTIAEQQAAQENVNV
mgnify:CR=1 FL=1|tara:strand:- start:2762 stop:4345 length:1584 start_codon:yes stop_codon:yes gene_type:complete